jgi:hypothetical protein
MLIGADEISGLPLFWAGEGLDSGDGFVEFPAESRTPAEGGAQ